MANQTASIAIFYLYALCSQNVCFLLEDMSHLTNRVILRSRSKNTRVNPRRRKCRIIKIVKRMNDKLPLLFSILPKSRQDPWSVKFLYEPFLYKKTLATMARPWSLAIPTSLGGTVQYTLYNAILRIARNLLETRENIKIESHSFYHLICDKFSWGSSKKNFFLKKKNQNGRFSKWPFFKMANSQKIFTKISQIGAWVSRID